MTQFINLNIETAVAFLFGITALFTIVMSAWAYIHQRRVESLHEATQAKMPIKDHGHFFVRARPGKS